MTLDYIAAAIEGVYYNGRPKTGSNKLDEYDFAVLARMANAAIMRARYFETLQAGLNVYLYFSAHIETKTFDVRDNGRGGKMFDLEANKDVVRLPNGIGIFSLMPHVEEGCACEAGVFHPGEPGSEWLYCSKEYKGSRYYVKKGRKVHLYGAPECMVKVDADGVFNDDEMDIPEDVAWEIVNQVLGITLKVAGFPVDKTDDNNPNVTVVKKELSQPTSL